jgi:CHAT domain-containing protein
VIRRDAAEHRKLGVTSRELEVLASQLLRAVGGGGSTTVLDTALRALHRAVIAPLQLRAPQEIIVVPDGVLRTIPFAALRADNGRYIAEESAIIVAASAGELVSRDVGVGSAITRSSPELLAVGNPLIDRTRWSALAPLPFAAREATQVAAMYGRANLVIGLQATKAQLMAQLPAADVFHFAGHAVANEQFPELSRLLLTPTGEDGGELLARELRDARLKRGSTVVLSACDTAAGPDRKAAGPQSLAQAFLTLGAGAVVAARWEVEDIDTSELMTALHAGMSRGTSPARALQAAQIGQIRSGKPVASWAAFVAFSRQLQ